MDFFALQDQARRRTVHLFGLYFLALAVVTFLLFSVASGLIEGVRFLLPAREEPPVPAWRDPHLLAWIVAYVALVVGGGALYRWLDLRNGGRAVARMFGARKLDTAAPGTRERRLCNVVEEMSIAAGIPVPEIHILDRQRSINALAAGYSIDDAAIVLTRGAIKHLDRDELQGVVAHEFSHILNGDMRLNLRLVSLLNGLVVIHLIGETLLYLVYDRDDAVGINLARGFASSLFGVAVLVLGFSLKVIGYVGAVAARLIQAEVSRQREFLADAAAVQFTRNPAGIAGALMKIGGHAQRGTVRDAHAGEASHMFIVEAVRYANSRFDSHPPLASRIRRIDSSFTGEFPAVADEPAPMEETATGSAPHPRDAWLTRIAPAMPSFQAGVVALEASQLEHARRILSGIPAAVREAVHEPAGAAAVLFYLLLWDRPAAFQNLEQAPAAVIHAFDRLLPDLRDLSVEAFLPLTEMLLPTLHQLSPEQYNLLCKQLEEAMDDNSLPLSGFCLRQVVLHHLDRHFDTASGRERGTIHSLQQVANPLAIVLGAFAHAGTKDTHKALQAAKMALPPTLRNFPLPSAAECGSRALTDALKVLVFLSPRLKKTVLEAALFCIASDERLVQEEAALLHMLAAALSLPAPALLGLNLPEEGEDLPAGSTSPQDASH